MPNPRYLTETGEPTVELLKKISFAKKVYNENLNDFCNKWAIEKKDLEKITDVYVIGSHATEKEWNDETSDLDLKIVNPNALPENLWRYKREVLDPKLHLGEKKRWVDLFFARENYQVTNPKFSVIEYWNGDI